MKVIKLKFEKDNKLLPLLVEQKKISCTVCTCDVGAQFKAAAFKDKADASFYICSIRSNNL